MDYFVRPQSSAIRIVDPNAPSPSGEKRNGSSVNDNNHVQRQCRNVLLYGYCKNEGRGCAFHHPSSSDEQLVDSSKSRRPSSSAGSLTPAAPEFVPKKTSQSSPLSTFKSISSSVPSPPPADSFHSYHTNSNYQQQQHYNDSSTSASSSPTNSFVPTAHAPAFVPKSAGTPNSAAVTMTANTTNATSATGVTGPPLSSSSSSTSPSMMESFHTSAANEYVQQPHLYHHANDLYAAEGGSGDAAFDSLNAQMSNMESQFYDLQYDPNAMNYYHSAAAVAAAPMFVRQPLNYHLYTPFLNTSKTVTRHESHFLPPKHELFQQLRSQSETIRGLAPSGTNLPEEIQGYHTLVPLEPTLPPNERRKVAGNWNTTTYRAINSNDGCPYCLVRIENYRLTNQDAFSHIEAWSKIKHPGLVALCEAFTTRAFGDNSVVFVYEYHSEAKTLYDHHFKSSPFPSANSGTNGNGHAASGNASSSFSSSSPFGGSGSSSSSSSTSKYNKHYNQIQRQIHGLSKDASTSLIPERIVWSYIVQLASAMKTVHNAGRAVQMIDVSRVIITGKNRVRFSTPGLPDVLTHDSQQQADIKLLQQMDVLLFGQLVFSLLTNNSVNMANHAVVGKGLEHIARNYSPQMKDVVVWLVGHAGSGADISHLLDQFLDKVVVEMDEALLALDKVQHHLLSELENARLVRLLCKFGFINERPEFARDARWSETGDRYILKLFRDYVFHQVDERGMPVVSLGHVLTCLNKLDAGTDEKVMLVSRDEQSCLVVSYREIKNCVQSAFQELTEPPANSAAGGGNSASMGGPLHHGMDPSMMMNRLTQGNYSLSQY